MIRSGRNILQLVFTNTLVKKLDVIGSLPSVRLEKRLGSAPCRRTPIDQEIPGESLRPESSGRGLPYSCQRFVPIREIRVALRLRFLGFLM